MLKYCILGLFFFFWVAGASAQCSMDCYGPKIAVIQNNGKVKSFHFLLGNAERDTFLKLNKNLMPKIKKTDTLIWHWSENFQKLLMVSYNPKSKKKTILVRFRSVSISIATDFSFTKVFQFSITSYIKDFKTDAQRPFSHFKDTLPVFTVPNACVGVTHQKINCTTPIANPYGPTATKKKRDQAAFSADSNWSYPLAQLKKALVAQQNTAIWKGAKNTISGWFDSAFADVSTDIRELHQIEFYMEEKDYNDLPMKAFIDNIYPGLFAGKNVQVTPHYKKNNIRGFRFLWYTFPMLRFGFQPGLKNGIPVYMIVRSTDDTKLVTNALYPESLFLKDSIFQDIYSSALPEERVKSILGWKCIAQKTQCNLDYIKSSQKEDVINRGYTFNGEIEIQKNRTDSIIGKIKTSGENIIILAIGCSAPEISVRLDESYNWAPLNMGNRHDYLLNSTFAVSTAFKKNTGEYLYKMKNKHDCDKIWLLFFSAASD